MRWLLIVALLVVGLLGIDRLLLAAEARGWIYYRRRKPSGGTLPAALLSVQSILDPGAAQAAEQLRAEDGGPEQDDESGGPPD